MWRWIPAVVFIVALCIGVQTQVANLMVLPDPGNP